MTLQGTRIQAYASAKSLTKFIDTATEKKVYLIANFSVSKNQSMYRAATHPYKIGFSPFTLIEEVEANIPLHSYQFTPLEEIVRVKDRNDVDHLLGMSSTLVFYK